MRCLPLLTLSALLAAPCAGQEFLHDFEAAKALARRESKDLFLEFTGTDWCTWCKQLRADVIDRPEFRAAIAKDYVLVELDYPNDTSHLSPETIAQNASLRERYEPDGFPTVVLADADGRPYHVIGGYRKGGPAAYLKLVAEGRAQKTRRDTLLAEASALSGTARLTKLREALAVLPRGVAGRFHPELQAEVDALTAASDLDARALAEAYLAERRGGRYDDDLTEDRAAFGRHFGALTEQERAAVRKDLLLRDFMAALADVRMAPGSTTGEPGGTPSDAAVLRLLAVRHALGEWPMGAPGNRALIAVAAWADARRDPILFAQCVEDLRVVRQNLGGNEAFLAWFDARLAALRAGTVEGDFLAAFFARDQVRARPRNGRGR